MQKKLSFVKAVTMGGDNWELYPHPGHAHYAASDPLTQDTKDFHIERARVLSRKNWPVSVRHRMLAGPQS